MKETEMVQTVHYIKFTDQDSIRIEVFKPKNTPVRLDVYRLKEDRDMDEFKITLMSE